MVSWTGRTGRTARGSETDSWWLGRRSQTSPITRARGLAVQRRLCFAVGQPSSAVSAAVRTGGGGEAAASKVSESVTAAGRRRWQGGRAMVMEVQRLFSAVAGAGAITVLLLLRMSRLWRLVFGLACPSAHGQKSQFSRLIRPLALGKADFACARGHRLRRLVEVRRQAKRQAMYVVVS